MGETIQGYINPGDGKPAALSWRPVRFSFLAIVGVVALSAFWWEPWIAGRMQAVAARRQCLTYVPPPNQVVFEEDPAALKQLADLPGYESTVGGRLRWIPPCWAAEVPGVKSQGTVFLHSLTNRAGHTRLVAVDVSVDPGMWRSTTGDVEDLSLVATVIVPSGGVAGDKSESTGQTVMWVCPVDPKPTRFFGGRVDPKDPAHFTFDYERSNIRGTIDGRLRDDDVVTVMPRRGTVSHAREPLMWEPDATN